MIMETMQHLSQKLDSLVEKVEGSNERDSYESDQDYSAQCIFPEGSRKICNGG